MELVDGLRCQAALMVRMAEEVETKGYTTIVRNMPKSLTNGKWLSSCFHDALPDYMHNVVKQEYGRHVLVVSIFPDVSTSSAEHPLGQRIKFGLVIPRLVRYAPICAALELSACVTDYRHHKVREGAGMLEEVRMSNTLSFYGRTVAGLRFLYSTLDMPQHREILLKNHKRRGE